MKIVIILACVVLPYISQAQFSGNNILEYQIGNLPEIKPQYLNTIYNRTNAQFAYKNLKTFIVIESFGSAYANRSYINPSQLGLQYSGNKIDLKLGNFYSTIGRGNLLRSFEIPGSILEDRSFRSRSYFYRDILGGEIKFKSNYLDIKAIVGAPLDNLYPPNQEIEVRRPEIIAAINPELKFKGHKYGTALMLHHNQNSQNQKTYLTNYLSSTLSENTSIFIELSNQIYSTINESDESHALYGGINFSKNKVGGSFEIKDYKNFVIGAGVNQPPALVREQTYRVLNRSIHVLQPVNESGFQLELFYEPKEGQMLTFNQTVNKNYFGKNFYYTETFLEYNREFDNKTTFKTFADYAIDNIKVEKHRISTGALLEFSITKSQKIKFETEFQTLKRQKKSIQNQVYVITYRPNKTFSISPILEISNDAFLIKSGNRYWPGAYIKYNFNSKLNLQLFAGKRRGGPSCNAGICYEVLDFEGVELRSNWRF